MKNKFLLLMILLSSTILTAYADEIDNSLYEYTVNQTIASAANTNILMNSSSSGGGYGYNNNPSNYMASVGALVGGYLTELNSYDIAFANYDMLMSMPRSERITMKYGNVYASAGNGADIMTYNPNQRAEEGFGIWFRPYATFEKAGLKNGPDVKNTAYGTYVGGDSKLIKFKKDWGLVISSYAGYNGSHLVFDGNSIYQNGGIMGATGILYKDNFFTGITTNIGANSANAETMYGREDFVTITRGIASKTGYNFGFKDDTFIIQPNLLLSNSSVYTLDYSNAAGERIKSDPLMAFQIAPGVKFIGNLKYSWQPYLGVQMVWNLMDKTKFTANHVDLQELSTKPYIQYGVGVQKHIGERFTGYMQSMVRNGGRNGIALSIGLRWKIGK